MNLNKAFFFGGSSEIALELSKYLKHDFEIISFSRKKTKCNNYFKEEVFNFTGKNIFNKIKKNCTNNSIKLVVFFQATQPKYKDFSLLDDKFINKVVNINCISSIKITYYLIKKKLISKDCKIIFFSSRSGSIKERGTFKFHKPGGNNLYRASKAILNSFIKNLAFEFQFTKYIFLAYHPGWVKTKSSGGKDLTKKKASDYFIKILKNIKKKHSGCFINYDLKKINW